MSEEIEYVFHNLRFLHKGFLREGSILVRDGRIMKFGTEPVIESTNHVHERVTVYTESGILMNGLIDQLSWLDGIRSDQELLRMKSKLYMGGILSSAWYWSAEPTRVGWLDMARRLVRISSDDILYGPFEYLERWKNIELPQTKEIAYYPGISDYTIVNGKFSGTGNREQIELQYSSINHETIALGTTMKWNDRHIPFALNLFFDQRNHIQTVIPLRHPQVRKMLWDQISFRICAGSGIPMEGYPAHDIGTYILPLIMTLDKKNLLVLRSPSLETQSFVILNREQRRKLPYEIPAIPRLRYEVSHVFTNGKMVLPIS